MGILSDLQSNSKQPCKLPNESYLKITLFYGLGKNKLFTQLDTKLPCLWKVTKKVASLVVDIAWGALQKLEINQLPRPNSRRSGPLNPARRNLTFWRRGVTLLSCPSLPCLYLTLNYTCILLTALPHSCHSLNLRSATLPYPTLPYLTLPYILYYYTLFPSCFSFLLLNYSIFAYLPVFLFSLFCV